MDSQIFFESGVSFLSHLSCAGRKKIRGGDVALAEAVRIFLIFCFFFIKKKKIKFTDNNDYFQIGAANLA